MLYELTYKHNICLWTLNILRKFVPNRHHTQMCLICARPITKNMVNEGLSYILAKLLNLRDYQAKLQDVLRTRWSNCTSVSSIRMLIQLILISICQVQPQYPVLSIVTFECATALQYIDELFVTESISQMRWSRKTARKRQHLVRQQVNQLWGPDDHWKEITWKSKARKYRRSSAFKLSVKQSRIVCHHLLLLSIINSSQEKLMTSIGDIILSDNI